MEDGFDGCNPSSNGSSHQQHNQLQSQQHGTRRRVKRRYRRNQDAINFLRRFTLAVVIIELMLAISESSLMSTFFLYLTLSSTFDVKPESVMDIYCYSQPPGNLICENYMQRVIGYPSMPSNPTGNHRYRGGNSPFPASSQNIENHFPSVPSRPVLTDNELLQLLFLYNQSFYDVPAKLAISRKINEKSTLSKFYSHLIYLFSESRFKDGDGSLHNKSTSNITSPEKLNSFAEAFLTSESHDKMGLLSHLHQSLEVVSSSAPWVDTYIPQMQTKSGAVPLRRVQNETSPREAAEVIPKKLEEIRLKEERSRASLVGGKRNNGLSPSSHRDLIQAKDFIRHRWKRNSMAFPPTFVQETPGKHSMTDPEVLSAAIGEVMTTAESKVAISAMEMADNQGMKETDLLRQYYITRQPQHQPSTVTQERGIGNKRDNENDIHTNGNNMRGGDVRDERKETGGWQETPFITNTGKMKQKQEDDDHDRSTSTLIPIITTSFFETPLSESFVHSTVKSNIQMTTSEMNPKDVHTKALQEESREQLRNQPQPSSFTSAKQPDRDHSQTKADIVKPSLQMIIATAETNLNEFMESFDAGRIQNPKRNSDHQVNNYASLGSSTATSKEARTISNKRKNQKWKNVYEMVAKLEKSPRQLLNLIEASLFNNWLLFMEFARQKAMSVNAKNDTNNSRSDNNSLENLRMKQFEDLTMNMEMDIFSAETYHVSERRKRAMQQIYHDYSSVIIGELSLLKEIPLSCSFQYVYLGVKIYVLAWHVAICSVLFFGSIFEDKTALNIWGILNILSSLLHFMVDEWINGVIQPEKTSSCIWFGVIYGVYKPITILLVGTLSSEILKKKGFKRKGLLANLREVIMGRKRPPLAGKYAEKLEDFAVSADDVKTELIKETKPLEESCSLCGTSSTSTTSNKSGKLLIKCDKVGLKSKNRIGSGSCCPCSLTTSDQAQDDLFANTDDDDEEEDEDELEEVIDDDDDSEDDDESDNDYQCSNDPSQGQRKKEHGEAKSLTNTFRPSLNNSPKLVLFSETKNTNPKPVKPSTGHDIAGTQGNLMLNGTANGISDIRGDSLLNGPIVDGGNLHI